MDKISATGSSAVERMAPRPEPIFGMPIENMSGGKTMPNKPSKKAMPINPVSIPVNDSVSAVGTRMIADKEIHRWK